jgi:hypothetical protein
MALKLQSSGYYMSMLLPKEGIYEFGVIPKINISN